MTGLAQSWRRQHPFVKALAGGAVAFFAIQALVFLFMPPAWAAISIPLTERITVNLGAVLDWAQFLLGAAGFWLIYKKASEAKAEASGAKVEAGEAKVASLQAVKQTDGVLEKVEALSGIAAVAKERVEVAGRAAAARTEALAEAKTEADIAALKSPAPAESAPSAGKLPLPVADDRTAGAAERSATALERTAVATEDKKK